MCLMIKIFANRFQDKKSRSAKECRNLKILVDIFCISIKELKRSLLVKVERNCKGKTNFLRQVNENLQIVFFGCSGYNGNLGCPLVQQPDGYTPKSHLGWCRGPSPKRCLPADQHGRAMAALQSRLWKPVFGGYAAGVGIPNGPHKRRCKLSHGTDLVVQMAGKGLAQKIFGSE